MEAWPNAIRVFGSDRYATNRAASLLYRGAGGFPFSDADASSGGASSLSMANNWWGLNRCPQAVIVVAADTPADALVAASLSDPTGLSREPYLRRSAAADPLFDPVGGYARVDTDFAPIILTSSARSGATGLSVDARLSIQDFRNGGCNKAREAIIVGGYSAVPLQVEDDLLSLGIDRVFRVSGSNRFGTAALIAQALGTASAPPSQIGCWDTNGRDGDLQMHFYGNSVVEWRPSLDECQLLERTVVLADGVTGADALAAGWWTSFWQVPVLLHDGSQRLRDETAAALLSLEIDNVIILGGVDAVSSEIVRQAGLLAGAATRRVSGADRYETSVAMAEQFGGWYPTGRSSDYSSVLMCVASSSGRGTNARGWSDSLSAGPLCGLASAGAANPLPPRRLLPPLTGQNLSETVLPTRPARDAVPIFLVPVGASRPSQYVDFYLSDVFEPADSWCSSARQLRQCAMPGFAIAFGGSSRLSERLIDTLSSTLSGKITTERGQNDPVLGNLAVTGLTMLSTHRTIGEGPLAACFERSALTSTRWLQIMAEDLVPPVANADIAIGNWYVDDAAGRTGLQRNSVPGCVRFTSESAESVYIRAVSGSGRESTTSRIGIFAADRLSLMNPHSAPIAEFFSGPTTSYIDPQQGQTELYFFSNNMLDGVVMSGLPATATSSTLGLTLVHGNEGSPSSFSANWSISTTSGTIEGSALGEALFRENLWHLNGISSVTGGSWTGMTGRGGFVATLEVNSPSLRDDSVEWNIDATGLTK